MGHSNLTVRQYWHPGGSVTLETFSRSALMHKRISTCRKGGRDQGWEIQNEWMAVVHWKLVQPTAYHCVSAILKQIIMGFKSSMCSLLEELSEHDSPCKLSKSSIFSILPSYYI